jgi:hypothetical protein
MQKTHAKKTVRTPTHLFAGLELLAHDAHRAQRVLDVQLARAALDERHVGAHRGGQLALCRAAKVKLRARGRGEQRHCRRRRGEHRHHQQARVMDPH